MKSKQLIKNPTVKNLTEFARKHTAKFLEKLDKVPSIFWCVGDQGVKALESPPLLTYDNSVLFEYRCKQLCIAEAAKATIVADACEALTDIKPTQCVAITVEIPGLQIISLYSILRDKTGKPKMGKLLEAPTVVHVCQFDQLLPIGIPTPAERIQALTDFAEAPRHHRNRLFQ
jgi:hypothetical protein